MWRAAEARLPPRAGDARGRLRALAAGRAARRAPRPLAEAAGRGRARRATAASWSWPRVGLGAVRHRHLVPDARVSTRVQRRFRDKVTIALESHVARLQASIATIAHQERPEYLDRLSVLRNQVFVLDHMYMSLFSTCGWILRLGVVDRAPHVDPSRARRCSPLFALPTVLTSTWRPGVERTAEERARVSSPPGPPPVHDRDHGAARQGGARHRHRRAAGPGAARRPGSAGTGPWPPPAGRARCWHTLAWAIFGGAYVGAIVFVSSGLRAPAGDVLLVLAAGSRLSAYIGATVGEIGFLRGIWLDGSRRLAWLEDYAASLVASADQPAPAQLREGHPPGGRLVRLSGHRSPRARRRRPRPARGRGGRARRRERRRQDDARQAAVQAVRADGGAHPRRRRAPGAHAGRRLARAPGRRVPGLLPLRAARPPLGRRRRRARASTTSPRSSRPWTGPGPTTSSTACRPASRPSSGRPGRAASRSRSASGRSSRWPAGSCATGRCCCVLDEPTAALDAETEHALFERYAAAARGGRHAGRHHDPRLAPLQHRAHGRPHRRARRRARGRGRHPRGAHGAGRPVRASSTASRPRPIAEPTRQSGRRRRPGGAPC